MEKNEIKFVKEIEEVPLTDALGNLVNDKDFLKFLNENLKKKEN